MEGVVCIKNEIVGLISVTFKGVCGDDFSFVTLVGV